MADGITYPNPEFDPSKADLQNAQDPTQYPNRKWSYDGQLDVWPTTPMAFPEHKDVWGFEGWKDYSQGHLWYDPEVEEWNIFQWPSRPQGLSEEWYHPIQKAKKEEFQKEALEAVKQYVRDNCHAEPVIADGPMPADDAGQAMYMKHRMGLLTDEQMDKLRRQANTASFKIYNATWDRPDNYVKGQRPVVYKPENNTYYIGADGGLHQGLYKIIYSPKEIEEFKNEQHPDGFLYMNTLQGDFPGHPELNAALTEFAKKNFPSVGEQSGNYSYQKDSGEDVHKYIDAYKQICGQYLYHWPGLKGKPTDPHLREWTPTEQGQNILRGGLLTDLTASGAIFLAAPRTFIGQNNFDFNVNDEYFHRAADRPGFRVDIDTLDPDKIDKLRFDSSGSGEMRYKGDIPGYSLQYTPSFKDQLVAKVGGMGQPDPEEWDHLRDEIKDETDPTQHPNRKWSHTYGPDGGYLDVWPVDEIAYPEHIDVWGNWGWENCSQGHLWYEDGKWWIYPWQERPHCLSRTKPKEAAVKDQFIARSVADVVKYVQDVLHGEPEIANEPMPADSRGQMYYSQQPYKKQKAKPTFDEGTAEADIAEIFDGAKFGDENIYYDAKKGVVYWYSSDPGAENDLTEVKEALLEIPEVKNVTISDKRPSGPWKKLASKAGAELYSNMKVEHMDANDYPKWGNDKGHQPGIYVIPTNTLYLSSGPAHHGDIIKEVGANETDNSIHVDFKNPHTCVLIADSPNVPEASLEALNYWAKEYRPGCSVMVEYNGADENRLPFDEYIEQVYTQGNGWNIPYCSYCEEYGHTPDFHEDEDPEYYHEEDAWGPPEPTPQPTIDWGSITTGPVNAPKIPVNVDPMIAHYQKIIENANEQLNYIHGHKKDFDEYFDDPVAYPHGYAQFLIHMWDNKLNNAMIKKHQLELKQKYGSRADYHWWLYDLDTGEMAIAPSWFSSEDGLEGALQGPDRWIRGRYWGGNKAEIKIDGHRGAESKGEVNQALNKVIKHISAQEGMSQFFAAESEFQVGDSVSVKLPGDKTDVGKVVTDYGDGTYLVQLNGIQWKLDESRLTSIVPAGQQTKGYAIYYADSRDKIEDEGFKVSPTIFTNQKQAEKLFSGLKNVDLWQIDITGMPLIPMDKDKPQGGFYVTEPIFPEQLYLMFGPSDPQQGNKAKTLAWSYSMRNGELLVAPNERLPNDHWRALDYPVDRMDGTYTPNQADPIVVLHSPKNLDPNKKRQHEAEIIKKLLTLPFS